MTLHRAAKDADGTLIKEEEVFDAAGVMPTPVWSNEEGKGWKYSYGVLPETDVDENEQSALPDGALPKTDADGNEYIYWVTEEFNEKDELNGFVPGFYPNYAKDDASATTVDSNTGD